MTHVWYEDETSGCEARSSWSSQKWRTDGVQRFRMSPTKLKPTTSETKSEEIYNKCDKQEELDYMNYASPPQRSLERCLESEDKKSVLHEDGDISISGRNIKVKMVKSMDLRLRYGVASVCGRRRGMEDAVALQPSFVQKQTESSLTRWHYFGVYDGHGCSHVAERCKERLHELVKEEAISDKNEEWKKTMERSFIRMDKEVVCWAETMMNSNCRCELQRPDCDAVGSTAVVSVITSEKIIVANCGDSRAVLCRDGKSVPLSTDHKPDRPDELDRILKAGGQVIYWDGARVLGVLGMSRAIGDTYLKPYVTPEPEVTMTDRIEEDEFLILASDGLWDVVTNEEACAMVQMYFSRKGKRRRRGETQTLEKGKKEKERVVEEETKKNKIKQETTDKACTHASVLLTKLALAKNSNDNVSVVVIDLRRKRHVA